MSHEAIAAELFRVGACAGCVLRHLGYRNIAAYSTAREVRLEDRERRTLDGNGNQLRYDQDSVNI